MCKVNPQLQKKIAQAFSNDSEELQVFRRFCQRLKTFSLQRTIVRWGIRNEFSCKTRY